MYYQEQHAVIKQHVKRTLKITAKQHQKRREKKKKAHYRSTEIFLRTTKVVRKNGQDTRGRLSLQHVSMSFHQSTVSKNILWRLVHLPIMLCAQKLFKSV